MSYGPVSIFSDSIASGASTSGGIDLKKAWSYIGVQVGTMSTAAQINVFNSTDDGTSFYQIYTPLANTATVGAYAMTIASAVGTNGGMCVLDAPMKYIRFVATAVVSGGVAFKIVCRD